MNSTNSFPDRRPSAGVLAKLLIGILTMACQAVMAADMVGEPSSGFSAKLIYPLDVQAAVEAMHKTLAQLSIAEQPGQGQSIDTDYVEGPDTPAAGGRTTHSRYKFVITFRPFAGNRTAVNIAARVENSAAPPAWHDATLFNLGAAHRASVWLYEKFEVSLSGSRVTSVAQRPVSAKGATAAGSAQPDASAASAAAPNAGQFDIVGLQLGMSPSAVAGLLKSKNLGNFGEFKDALAYPAATGGLKPVPGGEYTSASSAYETGANFFGQKPNGAGEFYRVYFTPEPGAEKAAQIAHVVHYPNQEPILESVLSDSLIKKYGQPLYRANGAMLWSISGTPVGKSASEYQSCLGPSQAVGGSERGGPLFLKMYHPNVIMNLGSDGLATIATRCGSEYLGATWFGSGDTPERRTVIAYTVSVFSTSLARDAMAKANKLAAAAVEASKNQAASQASKQPGPTL